eukprot:scaffold113545_cov33-Prasinocladus_malaysianus.AAC.1
MVLCSSKSLTHIGALYGGVRQDAQSCCFSMVSAAILTQTSCTFPRKSSAFKQDKLFSGADNAVKGFRNECTSSNSTYDLLVLSSCEQTSMVATVGAHAQKALAGKEHAYDPGGRVIESRPNQTSTTCARTCKTPGLSYADKTSTSDVWRALMAAPRLSAS